MGERVPETWRGATAVGLGGAEAALMVKSLLPSENFAGLRIWAARVFMELGFVRQFDRGGGGVYRERERDLTLMVKALMVKAPCSQLVRAQLQVQL